MIASKQKLNETRTLKIQHLKRRWQMSAIQGISVFKSLKIKEDEDIWEDSMVEPHTYFGMGPYAIEAKVDEQMFLACGQESHLSSINPSLLSSFVLNYSKEGDWGCEEQDRFQYLVSLYGEVKEMARSTSVDEN